MRPPRYVDPAALPCKSCVFYHPKAYGAGGYGKCLVDYGEFKVTYLVEATGGCERYRYDKDKAE